MPQIAQRNADGTVTIRYDDGTVSGAIAPVGTSDATKAQHLAHVLLTQLNAANAAKKDHAAHMAHVEHVTAKTSGNLRSIDRNGKPALDAGGNVIPLSTAAGGNKAQNKLFIANRNANDLRLYAQPSFFGLYRTDYALGKTLSDLRAAGASPTRIGQVYRAGLQARRNEAEAPAQYLEAAAGGFTQTPGLLGSSSAPSSTLADILGSFTGGALPAGYGSSVLDTSTADGASSSAGIPPAMILAVAAAGLFLVMKHGRKRARH